MAVNGQSQIREESRINSQNVSGHNLQSSYLLPEHLNIKLYNTTTVPVVVYACETLSTALYEKHGSTVFGIFGSKGEELTGDSFTSGRKLLIYLSNNQLLKKESAHWGWLFKDILQNQVSQFKRKK